MVDGEGICTAYDELASGYDEELERDGWMRRRLWRHFDRLFGAGDRVLDVGCGTGVTGHTDPGVLRPEDRSPEIS